MFRRDKNKIVTVEYTGGSVKPAVGHMTLYWWRKGNKIDGFWFKGDLYGIDGELFLSGLLGDTFEELHDNAKNWKLYRDWK